MEFGENQKNLLDSVYQSLLDGLNQKTALLPYESGKSLGKWVQSRDFTIEGYQKADIRDVCGCIHLEFLRLSKIDNKEVLETHFPISTPRLLANSALEKLGLISTTGAGTKYADTSITPWANDSSLLFSSDCLKKKHNANSFDAFEHYMTHARILADRERDSLPRPATRIADFHKSQDASNSALTTKFVMNFFSFVATTESLGAKIKDDDEVVQFFGNPRTSKPRKIENNFYEETFKDISFVVFSIPIFSSNQYIGSFEVIAFSPEITTLEISGIQQAIYSVCCEMARKFKEGYASALELDIKDKVENSPASVSDPFDDGKLLIFTIGRLYKFLSKKEQDGFRDRLRGVPLLEGGQDKDPWKLVAGASNDSLINTFLYRIGFSEVDEKRAARHAITSLLYGASDIKKIFPLKGDTSLSDIQSTPFKSKGLGPELAKTLEAVDKPKKPSSKKKGLGLHGWLTEEWPEIT
jgi:hypothetical protein